MPCLVMQNDMFLYVIHNKKCKANLSVRMTDAAENMLTTYLYSAYSACCNFIVMLCTVCVFSPKCLHILYYGAETQMIDYKKKLR